MEKEDERIKTVLVTGAAEGIGRATSLALAREQARVIIVDRNGSGLRAVEAELGDRCLLARVVDVGDRAAMTALAAEVDRLVPAIDVLVNNAGVGFFGGLTGTSLDEWSWVLGSNLWGVIHGCHLFVPPMVRRGRGHVINVASALGYFAAPGALAYVTAKFAVVGLSESLRAELAPKGVHVTAVCPGLVATSILRDAPLHFSGTSPETLRKRLEAFYQRWGDSPERVAEAIVTTIRQPKMGRGVVPVGRGAQGLAYMQRFFPRLSGVMGETLGQRAFRSGLNDVPERSDAATRRR